MSSFSNLVDLTNWNCPAETPNRCINNSGPSHSLHSEANSENHFKNIRCWEDINCTSNKNRGIPFRIMSYNILAQLLLEYHSYLYSNCSQEDLGWDVRFPRIQREIIAQNPDIICFQELQFDHVDDFYSHLKNYGYKYIYKQRTGVRVDGCAIFYKSSVFDIVDHQSVEFRQPSTDILNRDNIGLMAKLRLKIMPDALFVICTTHLLYNPKRIDVRLAQVQVFLAEIDRFAHYVDMNTKKTQHLPVIITGDFNSAPTTPVIKLLTEGYVNYQQYNSGLKNIAVTDFSQHLGVYLKRRKGIKISDEELSMLYHSEKDEPSNSEPTYESDSYESFFNRGRIKHRFNLRSIYDFKRDGKSEVTTHQDFWLTVDYIFYSSGSVSNIEVTERYRLPTEDECNNMGAIPNKVFASDHFSLGAGFKIVPQVPLSSV